ncbi:MAG: sugar transferase [Chloroflexota bacterium]|nr:sugar transferase [Chloroflexota bacterium]MDQ5864730.1 sugar transferase [Chloroflexota bacterium]
MDGKRGYEICKRLFDLFCASIALLVLSPLLLAIAILVKLDSPGPVLYRALRAGRYNVPFHMLKFRSMVVGADTMGGLSVGRNDPRVTRVGRFLRKYKLDELPQLLNVLKGEMSLVGPRPEFLQYTQQYEGEELLILAVPVGITDYASVAFMRMEEFLGNGDPDRAYEEQIRPVKNALRVRYAREQSFWGDLVILFRTLRCLVGDWDGGHELAGEWHLSRR